MNLTTEIPPQSPPQLKRTDHPAAPKPFWQEESFQNAVAYAIGIIGVLLSGYFLGLREGGDSPSHWALADRLKTSFSWSGLYQGRSAQFHMTHLWMALFGKSGYVVFLAALTSLVPRLALSILRSCDVRPSLCLVGVLIAGGHPEIYKWAFYILTDGWFLVCVTLFLFCLTQPKLRPFAGFVIPLAAYTVLHSRPTGVFFLPALAVFAALHPEKRWRRGIGLLTLGFAVWCAGLIFLGSGRSDMHREWGRQDFIHGNTIEDRRLDVLMPTPFTIEEAQSRSVGSLCLEYPAYCGSYFAKKFSRFVWPVFPYYSPKHKIINAVYFGGLIAASVWGLFGIWLRRRRARRSLALALCLSAFTLVFTAAFFHTFITHIDTDTRNLIVWTVPWAIAVTLAMELALRDTEFFPRS